MFLFFVVELVDTVEWSARDLFLLWFERRKSRWTESTSPLVEMDI